MNKQNGKQKVKQSTDKSKAKDIIVIVLLLALNCVYFWWINISANRAIMIFRIIYWAIVIIVDGFIVITFGSEYKAMVKELKTSEQNGAEISHGLKVTKKLQLIKDNLLLLTGINTPFFYGSFVLYILGPIVRNFNIFLGVAVLASIVPVFGIYHLADIGRRGSSHRSVSQQTTYTPPADNSMSMFELLGTLDSDSATKEELYSNAVINGDYFAAAMIADSMDDD